MCTATPDMCSENELEATLQEPSTSHIGAVAKVSVTSFIISGLKLNI